MQPEDLPFTYSGDKLTVDDAVLKKWNQNPSPTMIDDHVKELRQLNAIKLDWGRNNGSRFPVQ